MNLYHMISSTKGLEISEMLETLQNMTDNHFDPASDEDWADKEDMEYLYNRLREIIAHFFR